MTSKERSWLVRRLIMASVVFLLSGCESTIAVRDAEIEAMKQAVKAAPRDANSLGRLADAYKAEYKKTLSPRLRDLAIDHYNRFLELRPEHPSASIALYEIMLTETLRKGNLTYAPEMKRLYAEVQLLRESDALPPSSAQAVVHYTRPSEPDPVRTTLDLLNRGVREDPDDLATRILMTRLYLNEQHYELALAVAREAQTLVSEEDRNQFQPLLAEVLFEMSNAHKCVTRNSYLDEGLKEVKAARAVDPSDAEMEYRLAKLYATKELYPLSLFTMKDLIKKKPTPWNRMMLAEFLWHSGEDTEALAIYSEYLGDPEEKSHALKMSGTIHLSQEKWERSADYFHEYFLTETEPEVYSALLLYLAEMGQDNRQAAMIALKTIRREHLKSDWDSALLSYYLEQMSTEELIGEATDLCKEVEAYFFIGMKKRADGVKGLGRKELEKVVELNLPQYYEHHMAKRTLATLASE
jgi:lipoprotein NlpI